MRIGDICCTMTIRCASHIRSAVAIRLTAAIRLGFAIHQAVAVRCAIVWCSCHAILGSIQLLSVKAIGSGEPFAIGLGSRQGR
jgi:hypothetical protein